MMLIDDQLFIKNGTDTPSSAKSRLKTDRVLY